MKWIVLDIDKDFLPPLTHIFERYSLILTADNGIISFSPRDYPPIRSRISSEQADAAIHFCRQNFGDDLNREIYSGFTMALSSRWGYCWVSRTDQFFMFRNEVDAIYFMVGCHPDQEDVRQ